MCTFVGPTRYMYMYLVLVGTYCRAVGIKVSTHGNTIGIMSKKRLRHSPRIRRDLLFVGGPKKWDH